MANELDKLRKMLTDAGIPFEDHQEKWPAAYDNLIRIECEADKYAINQIVYGRTAPHAWKLDGICQKGSYGREQGLIEIYGELVGANPKPVTAEQAFALIKDDFDRQPKSEGVE